LGEGGFDSPQAAGAFIILLTQTRAPAPEGFAMHGVDASAPKSAPEKALLLREGAVVAVSQKLQLDNPDTVIQFEESSSINLLSNYVSALSGVSTGELNRFTKCFWEVQLGGGWNFIQTSVNKTECYAGLSNVIFWENERGALYQHAQSVRHLNHAAQNWLRGKPNWGRPGICSRSCRTPPTRMNTGVAPIPRGGQSLENRQIRI
jgi:hypothetical protein